MVDETGAMVMIRKKLTEYNHLIGQGDAARRCVGSNPMGPVLRAIGTVIAPLT